MKSIIQEEKECFVCHSQRFLEVHHCLHGTANRKMADKFGLTVYLCPYCHRGKYGVHHNADLDNKLKVIAQKAFEEHFPDLEFIDFFGRNYT